LEFLSELRGTESGRDLPVIVVSIRSPGSARDLEGQALRLHDWIEKPIDQERLLSAVASVTRREGLPRILHIEDDADFASIVRMTLDEVADVEYAGSFSAAVERLDRHDPRIDLVLLDLGLEDGSGLEIIPLIREHHSGAIVVILTGQDIDAGVTAEVHAILEKSRTSNQDLVAQISSFLPSESAEV
jgi:DNA-binding response OmpR family regulator